MSGSQSLKPLPLVCEEVFDEKSQPSEEEVLEFAVRMGIDPDAEPHMIPLAREGLLKPLPKNWKPVYDQDTKRYYYFNFKTGQTSWEHPLDNKLRDFVKKSRSESLSSAGEEDSKTSIKEELKSFEETAASIGLDSDGSICTKDNITDLLPHKGQSTSGHSFAASSPLIPILKSALSPLRTNRKGDKENLFVGRHKGKTPTGKNSLKPIFTPKPLFSQSSLDEPKSSESIFNKSPKFDWDEFSAYLDEDSEQLHELVNHNTGGKDKLSTSLKSPSSSTVGRFTVNKVCKIDIDMQSRRLDSDGSDNIHRTIDRFSRNAQGHQELTLSGGGSMFLKSNQKKTEVKNEDKLTQSLNFESNTVGVQNKSGNLTKLEEQISLETPGSYTSSFDSASIANSSLTRSILRTPQGDKRLWDVDPLHMSVSEKTLWKQQELEEEKKSVRFNLDKELNISFKLSGSSDSDLESEVEQVIDEKEFKWNPKNSGKQLEVKFSPTTNVYATSSSRRLISGEESKNIFSDKHIFNKKNSEEVEELCSTSKNESDSPSSLQFDVKISNSANQISDSHKAVSSVPGQVSTDKQTIEDDKLLDQAFADIEPRQDNSIHELKSELSQIHMQEKSNEEISDSSPKSDTTHKPADLIKDEPSNLPGTNFMVQVKEKLEDVIEKGLSVQDDLDSRETRARDQAFRDWNVTQNYNETHRPQLSRQQSQQQLQQRRQQIQEQTRAVDRDRAFREWSVIDGSNDTANNFEASGLKSLPEKNEVVASASNLHTSDWIDKSESKPCTTPENKGKGLSDSNDEHETIKSLENLLSHRVDELKQNYEKQLKGKELELKLKIEEDEQVMVQLYQTKLQERLGEEAKKYEQKFKDMANRLEREADARIKQLREQLEHKQECAHQMLQEQHQQALAAQEVENQAAMLRVREQFGAEIKSVREQFHREEEQFRKEHLDRIASLREDRDCKRSKETTDNLRVIEKLRCEKRLVEDKYRTLKEKYVKLKGEIKSNIEKKEQKQKDLHHGDAKDRPKQIQTTEQEIYISQTQQQSDRSSEAESRPKVMSSGSSATSSAVGFQQAQSQTLQQGQLNTLLDPPSPAPDSGPPRNNNNDPFLGMNFPDFLPGNEFHSNSYQNTAFQPLRSNNTNFKATEKNGNIPSSSHGKYRSNQQFKGQSSIFSPLEALRHQLRTLDEIEDQIPSTSVTDAYLRYPFSDSGNKELGSAEMEFFRHRIHLERDMIRQAKNTLQAEQSAYRSRLLEFQQRKSSSSLAHPSTTLYEMAKEEQDLSEIEAKLKRTRSLLSEKIVHLRHLESSLYSFTGSKAQPASHPSSNGLHSGFRQDTSESHWTEKVRGKPQRRWDWKFGGRLGVEDLSDDPSSDSGGSSGFSSTEHTSDGTLASLLSYSGSNRRFKQTEENSSDINVSLHNLNAEISEIWNVLCKQRAAVGLGPPPLLHSGAHTWFDSTAPNRSNPVQSPKPVLSSPVISHSVSKVITEKNSSLIQRTNNLRQWLQKAKMSATLLNAAPARDQTEVSF